MYNKKQKISSFTLVGCLSLACLVSSCKNNPETPQPITQPQAQEKPTMTRITLPSGLAYEVLNHGTADDSPKPGDKVTVHYTGWLNNGGQQGKKFDSSVDRGQPFVFTIGQGQVIKGWDEGVLSMRKNEKRRLFIPANLAYGSQAVGGDLIPANSALIFDVELLDFKS